MLPLLFVVVLATGIRCYHLDWPVLSSDESFSWRMTEYPVAEQIQRTAVDVHPPLYYLLLTAWLHCWGATAFALRGFSVFWGVLCVPLVYAVCREAYADRPASQGPSRTVMVSAALLSALVLTLHLSQVTPSRIGRMYTLGVFLAGLTTWLLLRAFRSQAPALWWSAYGLAVAAFCYTHYYAFFTVFAQALFVAGDLLVRWRTTSFRNLLLQLGGFLFAAAVALVLYMPWLPVLWSQMHEVRQAYWIPSITPDAVERMFFSWATGMDYPGALEARAWLVAFLLAITLMVWQGDRPTCCFLLGALVPWALALGISLASGRSILVERYLAFAHFAFVAFWATVWCRLPGWPERVALACLLGSIGVSGLWNATARLPEQRPAIESAAAFLKDHYQAGDIVIVNGAVAVNRLRCYAAQAGIDSFAVRTRINPFARNLHMSHEAALAPDEILLKEPAGQRSARRIWRADEHGAIAAEPPQGMKAALERTFKGGAGSRHTLVLYVRQGR